MGPTKPAAPKADAACAVADDVCSVTERLVYEIYSADAVPPRVSARLRALERVRDAIHGLARDGPDQPSEVSRLLRRLINISVQTARSALT
jgi:hypothetical protein